LLASVIPGEAQQLVLLRFAKLAKAFRIGRGTASGNQREGFSTPKPFSYLQEIFELLSLFGTPQKTKTAMVMAACEN